MKREAVRMRDTGTTAKTDDGPPWVQKSGEYLVDRSTTGTDADPEHCVHSWDSCSSDYEQFAVGITRLFAQDAARLVRIEPDSTVLDVAAGTGEFAFAAAQRGARVLATDFSMSMLSLLEKRRSFHSLHNVTTELMDGQALSLEDETFDVAGSLFGLVFFPDQFKGLSELYRVLKPGGQAIVATWAMPGRVELMRIVGEALMSACPEVCEQRSPARWTALSDRRRLHGALREVGFRCVHVLELSHVWTFDAVEDFARALPRMTPGWQALEAVMNAEQRARFHTTLVEDFKRRQGLGPFAVTAQGLMGVGSKFD